MVEPSELEVRRIVSALRASRRRALLRGLSTLCAVIAMAAVISVHGRSLRLLIRGEMHLDGRPRYQPPEAPNPQRLARIDFARVHGELLPAWTLAMANADSSYWERRADERFEELASELAPDPNLRRLMVHTHRDLRDDPLAHARRVDYRLWAYNEYLDQNDIPWRVEAALAIGRERTVLRTLSYQVVADTRNERGQRVRLLRRYDRIGSREGWLGKTAPDGTGAFVLMRRVLHFTVRHVWPALHPALDQRRPVSERPWLPFVRRQVASQVPAETMRLLSETAVDQQALIEVAADVEARASCGSRLRFHGLPYNGLSRRSILALEGALRRSQGRPECPEVTLDEAARIVGASERLAGTTGLAEALERLAMVVARAVAVHELRHVADGPDLACPGCPEGLNGLARDEVSAYLAAFGDEQLGYLALLTACAMPPSPTIHGQALQRVIEAVLPFGCSGPAWDGVSATARDLSRELFGERAVAEVPSLPERVRLLPGTDPPEEAEASR